MSKRIHFEFIDCVNERKIQYLDNSTSGIYHQCRYGPRRTASLSQHFCTTSQKCHCTGRHRRCPEMESTSILPSSVHVRSPCYTSEPLSHRRPKKYPADPTFWKTRRLASCISLHTRGFVVRRACPCTWTGPRSLFQLEIVKHL